MKPKRELIRIIRTSEEEIQVDATGKKNGRGAYICPERGCLDLAVKSRGLWLFPKKSMKILKRRWENLIRDNVLSMLGIAAKAGRVASGEYQTENMVKSGKSHLVIVAEDASDNTKKTFRNKCEFYETPMVIYGNKESLGHAIGREYRASLAVTDEGFAKALLKKLAQKTTE